MMTHKIIALFICATFSAISLTAHADGSKIVDRIKNEITTLNFDIGQCDDTLKFNIDKTEFCNLAKAFLSELNKSKNQEQRILVLNNYLKLLERAATRGKRSDSKEWQLIQAKYKEIMQEFIVKTSSISNFTNSSWSLNNDFDLAVTDFHAGGERLFNYSYFEVSYKDYIQEQCAQVLAQKCESAENDVLSILAASYVAMGMVHKINGDNLKEYAELLKGFNEDWGYYLTKSRATWPWEIYINERFYKLREDDKVNGFAPPPKTQLIIAHPYVGLTYNDENSELEPSLLIDLIGKYKWSRSDKFLSDWGASLTASWNGDDVGLGLALHFKKGFSFAVTRTDETTLFSISREFGTFYQSKKQEIEGLKNRLQQQIIKP